LLQWAVDLANDYLPHDFLGDVRRIVIAKAASRVHDIGGWGDIAKFNRLHRGMVVNVALGLWTVVIAIELKRKGPVYYHPIDLSLSGLTLNHEKAAVLRETIAEVREHPTFRPSQGYEMHYLVVGQTPPNAGLGSSASLGVALAKAAMVMYGVEHETYDVAMAALIVESERLDLLTGNQDHAAAAFGGIQAIEIEKGAFPHFRQVALDPGLRMRRQIEAGTTLVYPGAAGRSVSSSRRHEDVIEGIDRGDEAVIGSIMDIVAIADQAKECLMQGNWEGYCQLYGQNGQCQLSLCDAMVTEEALQIIQLAEKLGAFARPNGAGGTIGVVAPKGAAQTIAIRQKLERELLPSIPGAMLLPMVIDDEGVAALSYDAEEVAFCVG
jgi:D-glycero-alpha-D-manno-heptose-7-phosphate kinase